MMLVPQLLSIRASREAQAERRVAESEAVHAEADRVHAAASVRLDRYRRRAASRERQWYERLCSEIVGLAEIGRVQRNVMALRAGQRREEEAVEGAAEVLREARERLEDDRGRLKEARRRKLKVGELANEWAGEQALEALRVEDIEIEEAAALLRHPCIGRSVHV